LVKVTVVIPVYNPGPFIEPGIDSLLAQTMPRDELEVVYVDDGSTDETPARLDVLAEAHPHIRVIHTPNSGWAGRPRNIGLAAANGEYVQFMDQDDALTPDALSLLYEMATHNRSDIVIGKVASNFRPVPQHLFRRNIDACTLHDAPLISSLTPHKMFRTAFLREHGIEFPEGRRRLEDQLFMVRAYLAARTVSVLADTVCYLYARRADGGNAAANNPDPAMYFANLREVLEVIVANTEPGAFRTELLSRFYRTGMIDRLSEPFYLSRPEPIRQALFREIRSLAEDFVDDDVHATQGTFRQVRSTLLRTNRQPALVELAQRLRGLHASATLGDLRWVGRRLLIDLQAGFVFAPDQRPFELVRRDGVTFIDPSILEGILDTPIAVREPSPWARLECFLRERTTGAEWRVPTAVRVRMARNRGPAGDLRLHPTLSAAATIDVDRIAGGHPLDAGSWELRARLFGPGIDRRTRVAPLADGRTRPVLPAAMATHDAGPGYVAVVEARGVGLRVGPSSPDEQAPRSPLPAGDPGPRIELPVPDAAATTPLELDVVARRRGSQRRLTGRLERVAGTAILDVRTGPHLAAGTWQLTARIDGADRPERAVGTLEIGVRVQSRRGRPAGPRLPFTGGLRRLARRGTRSIARRLSTSLRRRIPDFLVRWL